MGLSKRSILSVHAAAGLVLAALTAGGAAAQDSQAKALAKAYNASGQRLFKQFAATPGNIVFSPYSIGTAMAMALAGARGETETEMARILQHQQKREEIDAANARLHAVLNGYDKSSAPPTCPDGMSWSGQRCESKPNAEGRCPFIARRDGEQCVADPVWIPPSAKLVTANALMLAKTGDFASQAYKTLLAEKYAAEVFQGVGLAEVNNWVKQKTQGKIEKILDMLPDVVLLNAVYFKARWQGTFSKEATKDEAFNLSRSQKVQVPTMNQRGHYVLTARPGYRAIRLPYSVDVLGMIILLPNEIDGLAGISGRLDTDELPNLFAALRATPAKLVDLSMPRFKTGFEASNLKEIFRKSGMTRPFDREKADFSGMTGRPASELPFWIDDIRHRAVIDVMEDGTEAAAVTALAFMAASAPRREPEPEIFRVERPFLFFIVDDATDAILFQGRIIDPR